MTNAILRGKPDAGNPHVRFDEGEVASAKPRRGSLLYKRIVLSVCAALAAAVVARGASTLDYVQDGLVAHWDGCENVGRWQHASTTAVWRDLIGGVEITKSNDGADFVVGERSITVPVGTTLAGTLPFLGDYSNPELTVEVVAKCVRMQDYANPLYLFSNSRGYLFLNKSGNGMFVRIRKGGAQDPTYNTSKFMTTGFDNFHTYSLCTDYTTLASPKYSFVVDGTNETARMFSAGTSAQSGESSKITLGRGGDAVISFEYQSIRIYSRKLTDAEFARNREVDVARFVNGDFRTELQVQGDPLPYGEVLPAYGDYALNAGDRRTCSVVSSTGIGRTNVTCIGYAVYTNDVRTAGAEYMSGAGSSFEYVHPANAYTTIVWKWHAEEDQTLPLVTNVTVDGLLGDALKVRGTLAELGGESCALKVLVRDADAETAQEWASADWTRTATGDFELELFESDPTSPRAFKFGKTYFVTVEATAEGRSSRGEAVSVTMPTSYATAASYVRDGLVSLYDGIENDGYGRHVDHPAVWKDLVGSGDISLPEEYATVGSDAVRLLRKDAARIDGTSPAMGSDRNPVTVEVLVRANSMGDISDYPQYIFNGMPILLFYSTATYGVSLRTPSTDDATYAAGSKFLDYYAYHTYSASFWYSGGGKRALSIDGATKDLSVGYNSTKITGSDLFFFGRASKNDMEADFRSLRIYSRVLTQEEIQQNRWTDRIRFDGEQPEDVLPDGVRLVRGGEIQYRIRVVSSAVGVGTDGESFATGTNDFWVAFGETITVHAQTSPGQRVVWTGAPADTVCSDTGDQVSFTVTRPLALAVDATFTPTHVWTGAASTDFASTANWTNATADAAVAAPTGDADVYIPAGCANQPTAATPFSVGSFRIGRLAGESGTATFTANTVQTNVVSGDVVVYAGGVLTHYGPVAASSAKPLLLSVGGNLTVCAGGLVSAEGKGSPKGTNYPSGQQYGNGSHDFYDSIRQPCFVGAGGAVAAGGGVIRLLVTGTATIDGTITADGQPDTTISGAGGAIWITAATYAGAGRVSACGGKGSAPYDQRGWFNGGGGRVALYAGASGEMFGGAVEATAGKIPASNTSPVTYAGTPGTVYLQTGDEPGTLIYDNIGAKTDVFLTLGTTLPEGADITFGSVVITNGTKLKLADGLTLRVRKNWLTRTGAFDAGANSDVIFESEETSVVNGNNMFRRLSCTTPGKKFLFETDANDVVGVVEGGSLTWKGVEDNLISVWPNEPDATWKLCVSKNSAYEFSHLSVSNSDASAGVSVTSPYSENLGGNKFWSFANPAKEGDLITWTGAEDSNWFNSGNWVDRYGDTRTVAPGDRVSIPGAPENQPVARAGDIAVCDLTVEAGASLELDSSNLTVTNALSVVGSLTADGNERIVCKGDVTFDGVSTYSGAGATFALTDGAVQNVMFGGKSFGAFEISKDGGEVHFADGLTADSFVLVAGGAFVVEFKSGATYAFGDFTACGYAGTEPAVTFRASEAETPWTVSASRRSFVSGVSASDSTAVGAPIRADVGCTLARCVNWNMGDRQVRLWKGGTGNFDTPSAWSPEGVPGETDVVQVYALVNEAPEITIRDARTVAELVVSGAGSPTLIVTGPFHVTGDAEIVGKTTVQMNSRNTWTVDGDLTFRTGSTLTQTTPASNADVAKYCISVDVGGDFTMEPGTVVNAEAMGAFAKASVEGSSTAGGGGGHGGRGANGGTSPVKCYGSIFAPVMYGGGGGGAKGGGLVRLSCGGTMRLDGPVNVDGGRNTSDKTANYSGAGGSVWLTCGLLTGSGTISARGGGWDLGAKSYAGAGGRISVWQKQDGNAFTGTLAARGGAGSGNTYAGGGGGAGSIYVSRGGNSKVGTVTFSNYGSAVLDSEFPMKDDGEAKKVYRDVTVVVTNAARLTLTGSATIRELELSSNAKVDLGTNTLTIISQAHKGFKGWPKGASIVSNQVDGVWGGIVWKKPGFALIIR